MKIGITALKSLTLKKIHFYSVKVEGKMTSEFKDFYLRMDQNSEDKEDFDTLISFLVKIGSLFGAKDKYFKEERLAQRIYEDRKLVVNVSENDYGLRLYCLKLNENVVILFNGCRKTVAGNVEYCENCNRHFNNANILAHAIDNAYNSKRLKINADFSLTFENDFELQTIKNGYK